MLTDGCQNLARSHFHHLCLMRASVHSSTSIFLVIALRSEVKFTKTCPCLSIVFGNGHMSHVTVGKHIVPYPIGGFHFRKRCGVTPKEQQTSVFQSIHSRHGDSTIEWRWTGLTPSQTTIFREGFVMIVQRSTHNHPQTSVIQFDYGRFHRSMIPADAFVEASLFMIGSGDDVRANPCQAVIVRHVCITSLGSDIAMGSDYDTFPSLNKYRWLHHDGIGIGYLDDGTSAIDSPFGTNAIDSHPRHVSNTDVFLAHRALSISKRHPYGCVHLLPCQAIVLAGEIEITRLCLFTEVVMTDFTRLEFRKADVGIGWRYTHLYRCEDGIDGGRDVLGLEADGCTE